MLAQSLVVRYRPPLFRRTIMNVDAYAGRFGYEQADELPAFRAELDRTIGRALARTEGDPGRRLQQVVDDLIELYEWRTRSLPPQHVKPAPRDRSSWFAALLAAVWVDYGLAPVADGAIAAALAQADPRTVAARHAQRSA
jgi:hypothetical protein